MSGYAVFQARLHLKHAIENVVIANRLDMGTHLDLFQREP